MSLSPAQSHLIDWITRQPETSDALAQVARTVASIEAEEKRAYGENVDADEELLLRDTISKAAALPRHSHADVRLRYGV